MLSTVAFIHPPPSLSHSLTHSLTHSLIQVGGANATVRSAQDACEPGSYCSGGVKLDCPAGTFGRTSRLTSPKCSGQCYAGHYCIPGSTSPTESPCPFGRYGRTRGLTNSKCSGACPRAYECNPGSTEPYANRIGGGAS